MVGLEIPNWENLILFVKNAADVIPSARFIGWDIAILENGFEMIEGNYHSDPGFLQALNKTGYKQRLFELRD